MIRGRAKKTIKMTDALVDILQRHHPMTVRQAYYQLVSRQVIENTRAQYQAVSNLLVQMRQEGYVSWGWIEDRIRQPRIVSMWDDLPDFGLTVRQAYRRNTWATQKAYIEVWLEKDALSGIFQDVLNPYGVTLNVGRGYDGWSSIYNAAMRYQECQGKIIILYFGDFDPSGEDMFRSLQERLAFFKTSQEMLKCAIIRQDIIDYNLPPDFTKASDSRQAAFIERWGDMAVELDALPVDVLQERIQREVETRLDMEAIKQVRDQEEEERERLKEMFT